MPTIGIVITCFNYGDYLADAIQSILDQTYDGWHLVIIDDGSTDNSVDVAKTFLPHPNIKLIEQQNKGVVAARNNGFDHLDDGIQYLMFLDADDKLHPDYLKELVEPLMKSGNQFQFAYCDAQYFGKSQDRFKAGKWNPYRLLFENYIPHCALMTREAFLSVGKYSEYMSGKYGFEDWELWIKFVGKGYNAAYIKKPYFLYRIHGHGRNEEGEKHRAQQIRLIRGANSELYNRPFVRLMIFINMVYWRLRRIFVRGLRSLISW